MAWSPKVQVPYRVVSGCVPRKLEIERRKRQYNRQARELENLLKEHHVSTQVSICVSVIRYPQHAAGFISNTQKHTHTLDRI